jgi:hypothetical protein
MISLEHDPENGDTLTYKDLVKIQYEYLPYPSIKQEQWLHEVAFYQTNETMPFKYYPSHSLEKHNHFFHLGKETFR